MPVSTARTSVALLGVVLVALPAVAAHTNHVDADPQVAGSDRVRVEAVFALVESWIVVHEANATGAPGEPIGHVAYDPDDGFRTDVPVPVAPSNGTLDGRLVAAIHRDAGGDGFDPDDDPILTRFGEPVVSPFTAVGGEAPVYVGAETFTAQDAADGTVRVRRADLARDGRLVVSANVSGGTHRVGVADLTAGLHGNVTVDVRRPPSVPDGEILQVEATIHREPSDGTVDDGDPPVRVGGEPVATRLAVAWQDPGDGRDGASDDVAPIPGPGGMVVTTLLVVLARGWPRQPDASR